AFAGRRRKDRRYWPRFDPPDTVRWKVNIDEGCWRVALVQVILARFFDSGCDCSVREGRKKWRPMTEQKRRCLSAIARALFPRSRFCSASLCFLCVTGALKRQVNGPSGRLSPH